jgi:hypothetical protein
MRVSLPAIAWFTAAFSERRWLQLSHRALPIGAIIGISAILIGWLGANVFWHRLYSDAEIEAAIAQHAIAPRSDFENREIVYLVVPNGESMPRNEAFEIIGLEDDRLRDFYWYRANGDVTMRWRVSASYEIECRTIADDFNGGMYFVHPSRNVYGINFRKPSPDEIRWRMQEVRDDFASTSDSP